MNHDVTQVLSTFDEAMQDPEFKKSFEEGYQEFLFSELYLAVMEEDTHDTSNLLTYLTQEGSVSPQTVPNLILTQKQKARFLKNFFNVFNRLDCQMAIKKGRRQIPFVKE